MDFTTMTNDLLYLDGLETIVLTIGATPHTVQALRRPLQPRITSGVQTDRAAWHVRAQDLGGDVPQLENTLTAGAETWTIKEVEHLSFGTRYRLTCEKT
jgi:hypothetical protein